MDKLTYESIDAYIEASPSEVQGILQEIRRIIKEAAPDAVEKISYQMPTFDLNGNLVHFAAFKQHIGFYPAPQGIEIFKEELAKYKGGKGSVQFPLDQPMPYDLISRITKYRAEENRAKRKGKAKKKSLSEQKE